MVVSALDSRPPITAAGREFYQRLAEKNAAPLWEVLAELVPPEPKTRCVPTLWQFAEQLRPLLVEAGTFITAQEAERRVLMLENPGIRPDSQITQSLYAGVQSVLPGETAPTHRHTASALRFVLESNGGYTAVDGERTVMQPGDFIVTPSWTYHDHGNLGSAPVMWLDVLDIPMARLTAQYLEYVEVMRRKSLELAAEYLVMAAVLIEIKSRMLLPRPPTVAADEEDPRAELVRRLLVYEQMKLAAHRIDELPQVGRDFMLVQVWIDKEAEQVLPTVSAEDLRQAWLWLLQRASVNKHHRVTRDQLSVREHMTLVLRRLQEASFLEFTQLFTPEDGVPKLVVTLLAVLELARESMIEVTQQVPYAPIYVKLSHGPTVV